MALGHAASAESLPSNEIRARQPFKSPVDPLTVTTMSDYDISLLLFRTWFNYDDGRIAQPDLISKWTFDEKNGAYTFTISSNAKWSDGSSVVPDDLLANLKRAIQSNSTYGLGVNEVVDISTFKALSKSQFTLRTKNGKPQEALFQRLGSIFLAVASPTDFSSSSTKLATNKRTLGPYMLSSVSPDELQFRPNPYFVNSNAKGPATIKIRKPDPEFDLMRFLEGKTWENYVQLNTIIPKQAAQKLLSSGLPYWTRGYDRVSVLKPLGTGRELQNRREILKALAYEFQALELPRLEMNVKRAESLQPFGYPLFQKLKYGKHAFKTVGEISVLAPNNYYGEFHRQYLEQSARKLGIKLKWQAVEIAQFYKEFPTASNYDFLLINYGVADPEPTTWMGLLFTANNFISFDEADLAAFKRISSAGSKTAEVTEYKDLLESIAFRGGYLPLFHFSTLSIGQKQMSFKAIGELDETVTFSKVIFE